MRSIKVPIEHNIREYPRPEKKPIDKIMSPSHKDNYEGKKMKIKQIKWSNIYEPPPCDAPTRADILRTLIKGTAELYGENNNSEENKKLDLSKASLLENPDFHLDVPSNESQFHDLAEKIVDPTTLSSLSMKTVYNILSYLNLPISMIDDPKIIEHCRTLISEMYSEYIHSLKYGTLRYYIRDENLMDNLLIDKELCEKVLSKPPMFTAEVYKARNVIKHNNIEIYTNNIIDELCLDELLISVNSVYQDILSIILPMIEHTFDYSTIAEYPKSLEQFRSIFISLIDDIDSVIKTQYFPNILSIIQNRVTQIEKPFVEEVNKYLQHKPMEGFYRPDIHTSFHEYMLLMTHKNSAYIPPLPHKPSINIYIY